MPGDLITTGSPAGVAAGFTPPKWLQPGDKIEIEIDSIGTLTAEVAITTKNH
jgi:2-keto-4-pentenoate hydratase/2-oxohepta-3-ene-1,7-dioic acid hydratase in catechol pathway